MALILTIVFSEITLNISERDGRVDTNKLFPLPGKSSFGEKVLTFKK